MTDLFGQPVIDRPQFTAHGKKKRDETPKGYAARPGSGPAGETCKTCANASLNTGYSKNYYKCLLLQRVWTSSYGTDIRLKSPACSYLQPKPAGEPAHKTV